jgi:hypothetical protein
LRRYTKWGKAVAALPVAVLDGFVVAAVWLVFCSQMPSMAGAYTRPFFSST